MEAACERGSPNLAWQRAARTEGTVFDVRRPAYWNFPRAAIAQSSYFSGDWEFISLMKPNGNRFIGVGAGIACSAGGEVFPVVGQRGAVILAIADDLNGAAVFQASVCR